MAWQNRLLIVDDDPAIGDLMVQVAEGLGFQTTYVERSDNLLSVCGVFQPDLIILDLMMPGTDGAQSLRSLADNKCSADIILFSGADTRVLNTAARLGESYGLKVRELLHKPVEVVDLEAALRRFMTPSASDLETALRVAIDKKDISVHFQPKVNLKSGHEWVVEGVEALARWTCPGRGFIPPADFIPLAEGAGLIDQLTDVVIEKAVPAIGDLHQDGHPIDLAVNISPLMLATSDAPDRFAQFLERHRLDTANFIVEITESAAMGDGPLTMENLTRFRLKGMMLSMDDFGTGFSSLVQLFRMPFSELKIDQSFVAELDVKEEARVIVRSIVDLAHNLKITVCAEGVETRETLAFLRSIGCDQAQGYLISKPLALGDLKAFLLASGQRPIVEAVAVEPTG